MLHLSASCKYYLYRQPTDMRKCFDSLSGIIMSELKMDVLSGAIFIFINKKHNQEKPTNVAPSVAPMVASDSYYL